MGFLADRVSELRRPSLLRRAGWPDATTLADLGELTAQWLEGRARCHPVYFAPQPDPESRPLINVLAYLNRSGFVTEQSQPACDVIGYGGHPTRQRAAVQGFADATTARTLVNAVRRAGLYGHMYPAGRRPINSHAVWVTEWAGQPYTRFGTVASLQEIADSWGDACSTAAVAALCDAQQVCLVDMEWGTRLRLWRVLERMRAPRRRAS